MYISVQFVFLLMLSLPLILLSVYGAQSVCMVQHICAVPHTSDVTIEVIIAGEICEK